MQENLVSAAELARHRSDDDCWIAFHGAVYNVSTFLNDHPGGKSTLTQLAGYDGSPEFDMHHPKSMLDRLPPDSRVGSLDPQDHEAAQKPSRGSDGPGCIQGFFVLLSHCFQGALNSSRRSRKEAELETSTSHLMTLADVVNVNDFELAAQQRMEKKSYDYYASAACDEYTKRENCTAYARVWLRPRIMVDVEHVDISCTLLGFSSSFPVFISPSAMAGLAHPDAELALARAAGRHGVIQVIANMASRDFEDITAAREPGQHQWFQVYINPDRQKSEAMLKRVMAAGIGALCVTVDTNVIGRRERDQRNKVNDKTNVAKVQRSENATSGGVIGALGNFTDARLCWKDLTWLQSIVSGRMKLLLKGVQTGEDAVLAAQHGLDGIIVSNHGGRQLDHARPTLDVLAEVTSALAEAGLTGKMEVYVDGGIRRGTDVYKALALGATAVGIGRPALYSLVFGQEGVEKCLQVLRDEFTNCMQLMGKQNVAEISNRDVVFKPAGGPQLSDGWPLPSRH